MFFDDFDNLFSGMFNRFRRPVLDQKYYSVYKKDKGYVIVFNTLGMDKDDINSCIRMTFSNETKEELDYVCFKLKECVERLRDFSK